MHPDRSKYDPNGTTDAQRWTGALNAVLRVVARHLNLLDATALSELATTINRHVRVGQLLIIVKEGGAHFVYSARADEAPRHNVGSGLQAIMPPADLEGVLEDTPQIRLSVERDVVTRIPQASGFHSYVSLPIVTGTGDSAHLLALFRASGAAEAPMEFLKEIADIIGTNLELSRRLMHAQRIAQIVETSADALLAWAPGGRVVEANAAASELTGIPHSELVGSTTIHSILRPVGRPPEGLTTARSALMELVTRDLSEHPRRVSVTIAPVHGDPSIEASALVRDESLAVAAEREAASHLTRIHLLENELRTLLDNAPLIIFRLDPETGKLLYLSRQAERLLRVPIDEALRTAGFLRTVHSEPETARVFDEAVLRARRGLHPPAYEARLRWKADEITVRGTIYPLLSDTGDVVAIEGIFADVSAEHTARTQLVKADRFSTLGMLAAGIAHEINNPAAFITLGLARLDRLLRDHESSRVLPTSHDGASPGDLVADLREAIERIANITRDLRLFAGSPLQDAPVLVNVNEAVRSALTLARAQIIEQARIDLDLQSVPPVLIEKGRLNQVLVNVLVNAAQAIAKQPRHEHVVEVVTRCVDNHAQISISDTGVGIGAENLNRIWLPFFTTKDPEVGTGLGLSISRELIERAGGAIHVTSPTLEDDGTEHGSRFVISLPIARSEKVQPSSRVAESDRSSRRLRVLIVDDERALTDALASELGRIHDVAVAYDGKQAFDLVRARRFDAVLCDLRMSGMSGEKLYQIVSETDPNLARTFVFMTGIGFGDDVQRFLTAVDRPFLQKPFSVEQAMVAISRAAGVVGHPEKPTSDAGPATGGDS